LTGEDGVPFQYSISLWEAGGGFGVEEERLVKPDGPGGGQSIFDRTVWEDQLKSDDRTAPLGRLMKPLMSSPNIPQSPKTDRSVLSQFGDFSELASQWPGMRALAFDLERITCYRDWSFGKISNFRQLQPVGLDSYRLATDSSNVAQVLKAMRDRGDASKFERLLELLRKFYEPVKDVDSELVGTHLRIMIKEEGLTSRTPAERLSDGTLRWLMLLIILLDPTPPPVICIDEPELGLHPDAIHTLADLLVDASTRTQLIITTHSDALLDAFTDTPDVVCVCEKVEGSTVIQRLDKERLKAWLEDYSLGQLWAKGEIGGNRW
jgi:predicted ATPase